MKIHLASLPINSLVAEFTSKAFTHEDLALYAQASGDLNPLHLDRTFAQQAGFRDVIVHGMLGMAVLSRVLSGYFPAASIRKFSARFASVIPVNNALHCRAHLVERDETSATLALEGLIANTDVVAISGTATVDLSLAD